MQLEFKVQNQLLTRIDKEVPVANSRGYLTAHFDLPETHTGLVTAYFKLYQNGSLVGEPVELDDNFICTVPDGVIKSGMLYVSLSCSDGSLFIPTNDVLVPISRSGVPTDILPEPDGTVNEMEAFQGMYNDMLLKHEVINEGLTAMKYKISVDDDGIFIEEVF